MNITLEEKVKMIENGDFLPDKFKTQFKEDKFINIREKSYIKSIIKNQLTIETSRHQKEIKKQIKQKQQENEFIKDLLLFSNKLIKTVDNGSNV